MPHSKRPGDADVRCPACGKYFKQAVNALLPGMIHFGTHCETGINLSKSDIEELVVKPG